MMSKGHDSTVDLTELIEIATEGLVPMYDRNARLFCDRLVRTRHGLQARSISRRYTMMTVLGLHRLQQSGTRSPIGIEAVIIRILDEIDSITNVGDLGLLLWLLATCAPSRLEAIYHSLHLETAVARYLDATQFQTMQLSWFLTGLSYAILSTDRRHPEITDIAADTYHALISNQTSKGLFHHQTAHPSLPAALRPRVATFADQIYPIYALIAFYRATNQSAALAAAARCANALCPLQGPLGQWWWHYLPVSGTVCSLYPVYSVHQHGMAPMALFALSEYLDSDFIKRINSGLSWLYGNNELGTNLIDSQARIIWRCIGPARATRYLSDLFCILFKQCLQPRHTALSITLHCRPYELGWLLYALCPRPLCISGSAPFNDKRQVRALTCPNA